MTFTIPTRPAWHRDALCRARGMGPSVFFPTCGNDARNNYPRCRVVCRACPVRLECLEEALKIDSELGIAYGFAGGMDPSERVAEARRRAGRSA